MSQISDLCTQLEKEYSRLLAEVEAEKVQQSTLRNGLNTKKKNLDDRESKIAEKEAILAKRESEIEVKFSKIRTDEEIAKEHDHALKLEEKLAKEKKEIIEKIAENQILMDEIHLKQAELSQDKATYKEKIKAEIQEELKRLIK